MGPNDPMIDLFCVVFCTPDDVNNSGVGTSPNRVYGFQPICVFIRANPSNQVSYKVRFAFC